MEKELVLAFKEAGIGITFMLLLAFMVWSVAKAFTYAIKKWSEVAAVRNKIEADKTGHAERQIAAYEKSVTMLDLITARLEAISIDQGQITLALKQISTQQTDTDRTITSGFEAAEKQVTADGDQTRAEMTTGFGGVGEGMDELKEKLHEVANQNAVQHAEILANITDLKDQIGLLMQRSDVPAGWRDQLTSLISVSNKLWSGMQALMSRADLSEGTEPPAALIQSKATGDIAPHTPETTAVEGER